MYSPPSTTDFSLDSDSHYTQYINLDSHIIQPIIQPFEKPLFSNLKNFVSSQLSNSHYERLMLKSKRLLKRENAKQRSKSKINEKDPFLNVIYPESAIKEENITVKEEISFISKENTESDTNCPPVDKERKKAIQKLRNRVSAQQSRDRKKQYLENLEKENAKLAQKVKILEEGRNTLIEENSKLKEQIYNKEEKKNINSGILRFGMAFFSLILVVFAMKKGEKLEVFNDVNYFLENNQIDKIERLWDLKSPPESKIEKILEEIKIDSSFLEKIEFYKTLEKNEVGNELLKIMKQIKSENIGLRENIDFENWKE